jgi:cysteine synthase A
MILKSILDHVGHTPIVQISNEEDKIDLYAKIEGFNPMGSIKDRAAQYVISKILREKIINQDTMIVESSSGNYGIALAAYTQAYGLSFTCVIDPNILPANEVILKYMHANIIKVQEPDENNGYLLSRIAKVQEMLHNHKNIYWIDQYNNPYNAEAYENTIGEEICSEFDRIDLAFIGVSSGGTITGVSWRLKKQYPDIKIIAIDIEGSVIFGHMPQHRSIPGIGSSMRSAILQRALIDDVIIVSEEDAKEACRTLLHHKHLFVGGSSGAVYAGAKHYLTKDSHLGKTALLIFPDGGHRYINTVF